MEDNIKLYAICVNYVGVRTIVLVKDRYKKLQIAHREIEETEDTPSNYKLSPIQFRNVKEGDFIHQGLICSIGNKKECEKLMQLPLDKLFPIK